MFLDNSFLFPTSFSFPPMSENDRQSAYDALLTWLRTDDPLLSSLTRVNGMRATSLAVGSRVVLHVESEVLPGSVLRGSIATAFISAYHAGLGHDVMVARLADINLVDNTHKVPPRRCEFGLLWYSKHKTKCIGGLATFGLR